MGRLSVYKDRPSAGAVLLKHALGVKWTSRRIPSTVINWGCSNDPQLGYKWLNHPDDIKASTNKRTFFYDWSETLRMPQYCLTSGEAAQWNSKVVVRNLLTSHSGTGIIILQPGDDIPNAPLYTQYVPKREEYRVHFMAGKIIDVQRKIRDPAVEPVDWHVRSHENGFIYVRGNVNLPDTAAEQAQLFIDKTKLDFGAIDIIVGASDKLAYVLEVNTAPGITGQTLDNYVSAFKGVEDNG